MREESPKIKMGILNHIIGCFLFGTLGYFLSAIVVGIASPDGILHFTDKIQEVLFHPFSNHWNRYSILFIAAGIGLWFLFAVYNSAEKQKKYRRGKEYGDARFESAGVLNRQIADPDDEYNRIFSQNVRMSYNFKKLRLNGNVLIIGGSGTGKTFFEVKPNLMQMPRDASFIVTDPKGEVLRDCGHMLKSNGYNVRVLNLLEMDKSDRYNPFKYIRTETDVTKLITNLIQNTTPKGASKGDPFWEKAETMFLSALFYYVWMESEVKNFGEVMRLLSLAKVTDKGDSELDKIFSELEERESGEGGVCTHPAVIQYNKCMRGAGDTVRSIIISANARLATVQNKEVLRLLEDDDMDIAEIGTGVDFDGKTKTALFCLIPDNDKSYNFIVGMLYTQIFQELYFQADFRYGGSLPLHVTFLLDEFANVALPDGYTDLITTMRSRGISSIIIIQNIAQLKELFDKSWEKIPGNCDTLIYLGGNELSTWEDISKRLGKETIDKMSNSQSFGKSGGGSRSYDVLGKELMMADQVGRIDNKKCILFVRGHYPVFDDKYDTSKHKNFDLLWSGGEKNKFIFEPRLRGAKVLGENSIKYYEGSKQIKDVGSLELFMYQEEMLAEERKQSIFVVNAKKKQDKETIKKESLKTESSTKNDFNSILEASGIGAKNRSASEAIDTRNNAEIMRKRNERSYHQIVRDYHELLERFNIAFVFHAETAHTEGKDIDFNKDMKLLQEFKERLDMCKDITGLPEFQDEASALCNEIKEKTNEFKEFIKKNNIETETD